MNKEITKNLMAVVMRNGIEIWIEKDKIKKLILILSTAKTSKFIVVENEVINTADIIGVFSAKTMEEFILRRPNPNKKLTHKKYG